MKQTTIRLSDIAGRCWKRRKLLLTNFAIAFVVSAAYILCIPRYYKAQVRVAPEETSGGSVSSLATIASHFGVDLGGASTTDAISPELYPDVFESNDFIVDLLSIEVCKADGSLKTTYYDYMLHHQQTTPWHPVVSWLKSLLPKPSAPDVSAAKSQGKGERLAQNGRKYVEGLDPFCLTMRQTMLVKTVKENISCQIDKKNNVLSIRVTDQDPLIAASMADSVRVRLQEYITAYRTSKARVDVAYYEQLVKQSLDAYVKSQREYATYADSHKESVLAMVSTEETKLENEMEGCYATYNALRTQLQSAQAKVQERTPAFTVLEIATVPVKPAGPKRMIFVGGMCMLTLLGSVVWLFRRELKQYLSDDSESASE